MVGTIRRFSDVLLIFMAKAAMPKKYRERIEHSTEDGKPLVIAVGPDLSKLSLAELQQWEALLVKANASGDSATSVQSPQSRKELGQ